jgi:hypothetical protein
MQSMYCVELNIHKKTISYCVKDGSGRIQSEGTISATRTDGGRPFRSLQAEGLAARRLIGFTSAVREL